MKNTIPILVLLVLSIFSTEAIAQDYKTAIGLRLGYPVSVSAKHFITDNGAIEANLGWRSRKNFGGFGYTSVSVSGAYLIHKELPIAELPGLNYYFGAGVSAFFWSWDYDNSYIGEQYGSSSFGILGYLGAEYNFDNIPLNLTIDWVPRIAIGGFGRGFGAGYGALGIRYILKR